MVWQYEAVVPGVGAVPWGCQVHVPWLVVEFSRWAVSKLAGVEERVHADAAQLFWPAWEAA